MDKNEVRRLFPRGIAFADACRAEFGDGVKLVYASENGREIGVRTVCDPERVVKLSDIADNLNPVTDVKDDRSIGGGSGRR